MDSSPSAGIRDACRAAAQLGRTVDVALRASDLTSAAYRLLAYLATGSTAATVLAEKLAVSRPSVTVTTDWLVKRGFATRTLDRDDRRRVTIQMTDKGAEALAEADKLVAERLVDVLGALEPLDAAAIVDALGRTFDALNQHRKSKHTRRTQNMASK